MVRDHVTGQSMKMWKNSSNTVNFGHLQLNLDTKLIGKHSIVASFITEG